MSDNTTVFCKFLIPRSLGVVSIDSDENAINSYLKVVRSELKSGNAEIISWSEFHNNDSFPEKDEQPPRPVTFIEVMISLGGVSIDDPESKLEIFEKAIEVLSGPNLQVTNSYRRGAECHVGFTQL